MSIVEATGRTESVSEDVLGGFGFLRATADGTPNPRRSRSAGGGIDNFAFSPDSPYDDDDAPSTPRAAPTYRPDILRTRGFDPGRLDATNSSNTYRGFSNLGEVSLGTGGLPTGFAEAAKMDTSDSGIAESLAGPNGVANTNTRALDVADLGLGAGGYCRERSMSPFTISTVPRQDTVFLLNYLLKPPPFQDTLIRIEMRLSSSGPGPTPAGRIGAAAYSSSYRPYASPPASTPSSTSLSALPETAVGRFSWSTPVSWSSSGFPSPCSSVSSVNTTRYDC